MPHELCQPYLSAPQFRFYKDAEFNFTCGKFNFRAIHLPGHADSSYAFLLNEQKFLFIGDTVFFAGCGIAPRTSFAALCQSLTRLRELSADFKLYYGHDLAKANLRFAGLVDKHNQQLIATEANFKRAIQAGLSPTSGISLKLERQINPFLRLADPSLVKNLQILLKKNQLSHLLPDNETLASMAESAPNEARFSCFFRTAHLKNYC